MQKDPLISKNLVVVLLSILCAVFSGIAFLFYLGGAEGLFIATPITLVFFFFLFDRIISQKKTGSVAKNDSKLVGILRKRIPDWIIFLLFGIIYF